MAKWVRVKKFENDTPKMGLHAHLNGLDMVEQFLDASGVACQRMADNLTSKTAVEARKDASRVEASKLHMGGINSKWDKSIGGWKNGGGTVWSGTLGGYVSRRPMKNGDPIKMIYFKSKETAANYGHYHQSKDGKSVVRMTSQVANLWENDSLYRKQSAVWINKFGTGAWNLKNGKPFRRPGKHFFQSAYEGAISRSIPTAIVRAEEKFEADLEKASKGRL